MRFYKFHYCNEIAYIITNFNANFESTAFGVSLRKFISLWIWLKKWNEIKDSFYPLNITMNIIFWIFYIHVFLVYSLLYSTFQLMKVVTMASEWHVCQTCLTFTTWIYFCWIIHRTYTKSKYVSIYYTIISLTKRL